MPYGVVPTVDTLSRIIFTQIRLSVTPAQLTPWKVESTRLTLVASTPINAFPASTLSVNVARRCRRSIIVASTCCILQTTAESGLCAVNTSIRIMVNLPGLSKHFLIEFRISGRDVTATEKHDVQWSLLVAEKYSYAAAILQKPL